MESFSKIKPIKLPTWMKSKNKKQIAKYVKKLRLQQNSKMYTSFESSGRQQEDFTVDPTPTVPNASTTKATAECKVKNPIKKKLDKNNPMRWISPDPKTKGITQVTEKVEEIPLPSKEIKWELNTLDEKDTSSPESNNEQIEDKPTPVPVQIVHGVAPKIKLVLGKNKPVRFAGSTSITPTDTTLPMKIRKPRPAGSVYPSGVPRTFLVNQSSIGAIQPQNQNPGVPRIFLANQTSLRATKPQNQNPVAAQMPEWTANAQPSAPDASTSSWQLNVDTSSAVAAAAAPPVTQQYSPSDMYSAADSQLEELQDDAEHESSGAQKRLSAFQRLGPLSQPKKPKMTINLMCSKDQSVREVVDIKEEEEYIPVHLRKDIINSKDELVVKYLPLWPWKRNVVSRKNVTARHSKSVMIMEQEQMEEIYAQDNLFIQVKVKGYPPSWKKENVFQVLLDTLKGKSFTPCFTEFSPEECKFIVNRCRTALIAIHKMGFVMHKDGVELTLSIAPTDLTFKHLEFIPRLVLRKLLAQGYDGERKLNLREFTLKEDISHFIYFPLNRSTNLIELVQLQSTVAWAYLTDLDLSHNNISNIDCLDLHSVTPRLKHLDLSYNWIDKVTAVLHWRNLPLHSIKLEGNPLCHDYIQPEHYIRVIKMIFPTLMEIDGLQLHLKGDMPPTKRNFSLPDASNLVDHFLGIFFPLLDSPPEERSRIEELYHEKAILTVTYRYKLRYSHLYRHFRNMFLRARVFDEGDDESIAGAGAITRLISKWPVIKHDPYSFFVDVMHHNESSTILRVGGILKLRSDTLAEDEHLLAFTRTIVLTTEDGNEYKIQNEMVYWEEPTKAYANSAFQINEITTKQLSLKFESTPDADLQEKLVKIFMKVTDLDKKSSERCLELKNWNIKSALEHFMKLLKLDDLQSLQKIIV